MGVAATLPELSEWTLHTKSKSSTVSVSDRNCLLMLPELH